MISIYEVEEFFPFPIKIEIHSGVVNFRNVAEELFEDLLDKHNARYDTKIERININCEDIFTTRETRLHYNEFEIYIGTELIHKGNGPVLSDNKNHNQVNSDLKFYEFIVSLFEGILDVWHNQIILVQEENKKKLKELEEEGYDEMLYGYYLYNYNNDRTFLYLKKLATRYPNSNYMNRLGVAYRTGKFGSYTKNEKLSEKITRQKSPKKFDNF